MALYPFYDNSIPESAKGKNKISQMALIFAFSTQQVALSPRLIHQEMTSSPGTELSGLLELLPWVSVSRCVCFLGPL